MKRLMLNLFAVVFLSGCTVTATCPPGMKISGIFCVPEGDESNKKEKKSDEIIASNPKVTEAESSREKEEQLAEEYHRQKNQERERIEKIAYEEELRRARLFLEREEERKRREAAAEAERKRREAAAEAERIRESERRNREIEACHSNGTVGACISWADQPFVNVCMNGNPVNDMARLFDINSWAYCNVRNPNIIRVTGSMRNNTKVILKDPVLSCDQLAESGTVLRTSRFTIYKTLSPNSPIDFQIDFARAQQVRSLSCSVKNWTR